MWPPVAAVIVCVILVTSIEWHFRHRTIIIPASTTATEGYVFLSTRDGMIEITCPTNISDCATIHLTQGKWYVERGVRPIVAQDGYMIPFPAQGCFDSKGKYDCSRDMSDGHYFEGDTKGNFKEVKP